jgi:hypothetical protein
LALALGTFLAVLIHLPYEDFVLDNNIIIFCTVLIFRIHEKNLSISKRRGSGDPQAQNIQLDLQPLCAQFPGEEDQRAPDVMSLKDPQVSNIILPFIRIS